MKQESAEKRQSQETASLLEILYGAVFVVIVIFFATVFVLHAQRQQGYKAPGEHLDAEKKLQSTSTRDIFGNTVTTFKDNSGREDAFANSVAEIEDNVTEIEDNVTEIEDSVTEIEDNYGRTISRDSDKSVGRSTFGSYSGYSTNDDNNDSGSRLLWGRVGRTSRDSQRIGNFTYHTILDADGNTIRGDSQRIGNFQYHTFWDSQGRTSSIWEYSP
ncbi:MAG: hypothetical protein NZT92_13165 [Abditibacteriales bacterium]|nr:hypothetical protein [Abditibacteriales bacterium]